MNKVFKRGNSVKSILTIFVMGILMSACFQTTLKACDNPVMDYPKYYGFNGSIDDWTQGTDDDFDWRTRSNGTPSSNTGPSGPYEGSDYLYIESSFPNYPNKSASIVSPCILFPFEGTPSISFAYHMYGSTINSLTLEISTDDEATWQSVWNLSGDQGNSWFTQTIDLSAYSSNFVKLRFVAVSGSGGSGWQSDIAIDDVQVNVDFPTACTNSILPNGDFESGSTGWTLTGGVNIDNVEMYAGSFCIELDDPLDYVSRNISVTERQTLLTSFYSKTFSSNGEGVLGYSFLNSSGTIIGTSEIPVRLENTYSEYSLTSVVPDGAVSADLFMERRPGTNSNYYFDDICIEIGNTVPRATDNDISVSNTMTSQSTNLITSDDDSGVDTDGDGDGLSVLAIESNRSSATDIVGVYGSLSWGSNGDITYTIDESDTDYISLACGIVGNDIFEYVIDDGKAGRDTASLVVSVSKVISKPTAGADQTICSGESLTFTTSSMGAGESYTWSFGSNANPSTAIGLGPHVVEFTNNHSTGANQGSNVILIATKDACVERDTASVIVRAVPDVTLTIENPDCDDALGSIELTFPDNTARTAMSVSLDNGSTYPIGFSDNIGSYLIDDLDPDTYNVWVRWGNTECPIYLQEVTIVGYTPPTLNAISNESICFRDSVTLTATSTNGIAPISYNWNNGLGAGDSHNVSPGVTTNYSVTVVDGNGCQDVTNVTVTVNTPPVGSLNVSDDEICDGLSTSISAEPSGMDYQWSASASNATTQAVLVSPTSSGGSAATTSYTVTITDSNTCKDTISTDVLAHPNPEVEIINDTICYAEVGTLTPAYSGASPFTYAWPDGSNSPTYSTALTSNASFSVTVTDTNGCITAEEGTIVVNPELLIEINDGSPEIGLCEGLNITLVSDVTGGTGSKTYLWNESLGTAPNVVVLPTDTTNYQVTVTDFRGCQATSSVTINTVEQITATSSVDVNICEGSITTISAYGGENYLWSDGQTGSSITVSPSETTTYQVDVTNPYGCYDNEEVVVNVSPEMSSVIDYNGSECLTNSTEISAVTDGGIGPYEYLWVGPEGLAGTTETIPVDTNGNYYVTITDDYGCESYSSGFVYERYLPTIVNLQANICEGDGVTLSLAESNVNSYLWSGNTGGATSASVVVFPSPPSESYMVTVTNDVGCTAVANSVIDVNPKPIVSFEEASTVCNGSLSNVIPNAGGIWFSSNAAVAIVNNQGETIATGPGSAALTFIESLHGCQSDPLVINVSANPTVSASADQTICNGELISISASGIGNGDLTYTWNEDLGEGDTKTFVPLGSDSIRTTKNYVVTVTDVNGCTQEDDLNVTIKSNPAPVVSKGDETCGLNNAFIKFDFINHPQRNTIKLSINGGETWLELSDNLGSYTFENRPPGIYELRSKWGEDDCEIDLGAIGLIPDPLPSAFVNIDNGTCGTTGEGSITLSFIDNINRSTLQVSLDGGVTYPYSAPDNIGNYVIENLDPGYYDIWLRWGDDSCPTDIEDAEILLATIPNVVATADTSLCEGSFLLLTAEGGSTYDWNDGSEGSPITVSPESTTTYVVTVTTEAGCTGTESVVVEVSPELVVDIGSNGTVCLTDSTKLTAIHSGGFSPFTYNWVGPAGLVSDSDTIDATSNGEYIITVTDAKGCEAITSALIYEEYEAYILNVNTDVCEGDQVSLSATASSGEIYSWNVLPDSNLQSIIVTPSVPNSEYFVTVTNSVGCQAVASANINVDASPDISLSGDDFVCVGSTTTLIGPSAGIWISSDTDVAIVGSNGVVTGLTPGEAFFTFIDLATGCQSLDFLSIEVGALPDAVITGETIICIGDTTDLSPFTGGTWVSSDPSIATVTDSGHVTALSSGLVDFTFTNNNGCVATTSQSLLIQPRPIILSPDNESICMGGVTNIYPSQGGLWISSDPSIATISNEGVITGVSPGSTTFYFTDLATSCISDESDSVTVLSGPPVSITGDSSLCIGSTSTLSPASGGTWESENPLIASVSNTGLVTALAPGSSRFIFTSSIDGCISEYTDPIEVNPDPVLVNTGSNSICIGSTTQYTPSVGGVWTSSNEAVATIDDTGLVTAVATGNAYFTYVDTVTFCISTTDTPLAVLSNPEIELNGPSQLCINESTSLQPSTGGTWTSDNTFVATVSNSGNVTAVSEGTVTFTFVENSTGCESSQSLSIDVLPKPDATITGPTVLCIGSTTNLSPTTGGVWSSDDPSVATVDNSGLVTAVNTGIARFTFVSEAGCVSNLTPPVLVQNNPQTALVGPESICVGAETNLLPATGGTWESTDPSIATISDIGFVTAISPGSVSFVFTDTITGCISDPSEPIDIIDSPVVNVPGDDNICIGQTTNVAPTVGGIWVSNNPTVASVDNSGVVVGLSSGVVTFTFTDSGTGCTSLPTDPITIEAGATVSISGDENICIGNTTTLLPNSGGTWTSTDESVAQVASDGTVTAISQGIARFQFTDSISGCQSDLTDPLTVSAPPSVSFVGNSDVCIGSTISVNPSTGGMWTSSDPSIATITDSGLITGISQGSVAFTFTEDASGCSSDGLLTALVLEPTVVGVSGSTEICIGGYSSLSPTTGDTWTSSNPDIAVVTNDGIVKGMSPGVVTFEFTDGSSGCSIGSITSPITISSCFNNDINVTTGSIEIASSLATNDDTPAGTTYGAAYTTISKPPLSSAVLDINEDGTYTFVSGVPGKYLFSIPICIPPSTLGCTKSILEITVLDNVFSVNNPVSNMDMATTYTGADEVSLGSPVIIDALANDKCVRISGCTLDESSGIISTLPANGTASIDGVGNITYTPNAGFIGFDTLVYTYCLDADPTSCTTTKQIITVNDLSAMNSIYAADDFSWTNPEETITGNILENDGDAESDLLVFVPVGSEAAPVSIEGGTYYIDGMGNYSFTPAENFSGYSEVIYTVCDDNVEQACTDATLHLLVFDDLTVPIKVYLEGAIIFNNDEEAPDGRPLMRDQLRVSPYTGDNYIPVKDPYTYAAGLLDYTDKYVKKGPGLMLANTIISDSTGVFSTSGRDAIVDWVFVEIRDKNNMYSTIGTRSGLLQRDGDVVDLDGVSDLKFEGVSADSFYVVINHKSHLAAMSMLVANGEIVDFTDLNTELFNFGTSKNNGLDYVGLSMNETVKPGYRALWSGDFDGNGVVKFANPNDDQNVIFYEVVVNEDNAYGNSNFDFGYGYFNSDFDMNGKVKYDNPDDDTNLLLFQMLTYPLNPVGQANFAELLEQVPR